MSLTVSNHLVPAHRRPPADAQARACSVLHQALHWLLITLLLVDLASSPWHTHRHDGELSPAQIAHAMEHDDHHWTSEHSFDESPAPSWEHSTAAIVRSQAEVAGLAAHLPLLAILIASPPEVVAVAPLTTESRRRACHGSLCQVVRSLPPDGRAPPLSA
jgi:hypothetical protein